MDIKYNEENRKRTISYILCRMIVGKKIEHKCTQRYCHPKNILYFIKQEEAIKYKYDIDVYVCMYQMIHICDQKCIGNVETTDGTMACDISGKTKLTFAPMKESASSKSGLDKDRLL